MQIRKIVSLGISLYCLNLLGTPAVVWANNDAQKQAELEKLRNHIESLKKEIEQKEGSRNSTLDALRQSEQEVNRINRKIYELERQQSSLDSSLAGLLTQTQTARQSIVNHQKYLKFWIRHKYLNKTPEITQVIFKKRNAEELFRHLYYYSYLAQAHAQKINQLNASLLNIKSLSTETRAKYVDIDKISLEQQQEKNKLQVELGNRNRLIAQLSTEIQSQKSQLDTLQQNEKRLGDLVDKLGSLPKITTSKPIENQADNQSKSDQTKQASTPAEKSFKSLQGTLKLPAEGTVKARYGMAREGTTTWKGYYINTKPEASVNAVADGRVIFASSLKGFVGQLIILDHGDHYMSLYGHNDSIIRQIGEEVKAGDKIAIAGSYDDADGVGVYFEIRHQGKTLNTTKWLQKQ